MTLKTCLVWEVGLFLCTLACNFQITFASGDILETQDCAKHEVAVVVASLGRSNADGDPEDLTWLTPDIEETKDVYVYQRSHSKTRHYIDTSNGNECLTYLTYIKDNYYTLPSAVIFIHADASRHCPLITNVLQLPNAHLLSLLNDPTRQIPGYLALSKVFLNQTKSNLEKFKYPLISFSNYVQKQKYKYQKYRLNPSSGREHGECKADPLPPDRPAAPRLSTVDEKRDAEEYATEYSSVLEDTFPFVFEYPEHITTYTSGSFIVSKANILNFPLHFYEQLSAQLHAGGRTCGYLEYIWTTMWGGAPFDTPPDADRSCGPLYYSDISTAKGFQFFASDDGSVEVGQLPDGYYGNIMLR